MSRFQRNAVALIVGLIIGGWAQFSHATMKAGAVVAFNLASCPDGWTTLSAAAGRFVIGKGTLGSDTYALNATGGEARHTLTTTEMPEHSHSYTTPMQIGSGPRQYVAPDYIFGTGSAGQSTTTTGGGAAHENRPPYVAFLYCSLDADDEAGESKSPSEALLVVGALALFTLGWIAAR